MAFILFSMILSASLILLMIFSVILKIRLAGLGFKASNSVLRFTIRASLSANRLITARLSGLFLAEPKAYDSEFMPSTSIKVRDKSMAVG
ncbi:MAG: hypothetical protein BWY78_00602 [Alphaproteobacteria bacterium ADurb.Bin438]|nr:MAG: hypothetical protein BWY78_00602 [Alphaproteobacteria bacterium ADurb.Bin438]